MLAALLSLLAAAPASPAATTPMPAAAPAPAAAPTPAAAPAGNPSGSTTAPASAGLEVVVDAVLPCGLRVLTARDVSLPVASVILTIETGSEDDPPESPGLVHALAYQLLQGNRELRPGESIAVAQDAGGLQNLRTGVAQVRFESLVPVTRLDAMLWVESQRLHAPNTAATRWQQALGWAAADERGGSRLRPEALAYLHGATGLGHDGRAVGKPLATLTEAALANHLAGKFSYARATLVVVAPESPERLLELVRPLFAALPQTRRMAPLRRIGPRPAIVTPAPAPEPALAPAAGLLGSTLLAAPAVPGGKDMSSGTAPAPVGKDMSPGTAPAPTDPAAVIITSGPAGASVPLSRQRGHTFAWAVPPTPAAGAWAAALCRAVNRQRKAPEPEESRKARLTCDYEPDPRRGVVILRPSGADDPWALVRARLARLAPGGADAPLLQSQAATIAQALRLAQRTPQGLAQQLAQAAVDDPTAPQSSFTRQHRVEDLTGVSALADPANLQREAPGLLRVEDAVVFTYPEVRP
jgi:predicted Zn-dependent peptidase